MRRAKAILLVCVLAASFALAAGPGARAAYACSCAGIQSPVEELESSDAVFAGKAVESGLEDPDPGDNAPFGGIRFDVERSWKGVSGDSVNIYGQGSSYYGPPGPQEGEMMVESSCAVNFDRNETYLVFASRAGEEGFLQANACGQTASLVGAPDVPEALGPPTLPDTGGLSPSLVGGAILAACIVAGALLARRGGWSR